MSAAVRLAWRYCTLFRIQRWLGLAAAVLGALSAAGALLAIRLGSPGGVVMAGTLAILCVAIFFFPATFVAGSMLRYWSAPSSHIVLPRLRPKMLGSVLLLAGSIAAAVWLLSFVGALAAAAAGPGPALTQRLLWAPFLVAFAIVTAAVYTSFRVTSAPRSIVIDILVAFIVIQIGVRGGAIPGAALAWVMLGALLAFWTVFSIWYLRTPRIAPVDLAGQNLRSVRQSRLPEPLDVPTAAEVLLTGRAPLGLGQALLGVALVGPGICVLLRLALGDPTENAPGPVPIEGLLAIGIASSAVGFSQFASRARYLWLLGIGPRAKVFAQLEGVLLRYSCFIVLTAAAFLVTYHYVVTPLGPARALAGLLLVVGIGPLTVYVSLARARNVGALEITVWILVVLAAIVPYFGFSQAVWPLSVVVWSALAQIVAAIVLRCMAQRNWRRVDWLQLRAVRPGRFGA